jgi:hypothetical protein
MLRLSNQAANSLPGTVTIAALVFDEHHRAAHRLGV